jgi:hypothetical protein
MNTNNLKTRIKSLKNDTKKVWVVPEFEVLDGRKTYGGRGYVYAEGEEWISEDEIVS